MNDEQPIDFDALAEAMKAHIASVTANPDWDKPPQRKGVNPTSATYWLPKITGVLPEWIPRTEIVHYEHHAAVCEMEGGRKYTDWKAVVAQTAESAGRLGFPVFIRTDLASAKHDGPMAYCAKDETEIERALLATIEDNELKFWTEGGPEVFLVREFLDLVAPFVAFQGLPVSREWRLFATADTVICSHPYWPADALQFYPDFPEPANWRNALSDLHKLPPTSEWDLLCNAAREAVKACELDTAWSVDFAQDKSGKWWLIDMALADRSWHWPDCPNA